MVKPIVRDVLFLQQKSEIATKADAAVIVDMMDTLKANAEHCVGMAANMIGVKKRLIVFDVGFGIVPMVNPIITKKIKPYETEEGCLSLTGVRKTKRFETIEVEYEDQNFQKRKQTFQGWAAQIIQHEVDHLEGVII